MYQTKKMGKNEVKTHFRMYKAGKHWITVGVSVTILGAGLLATNTAVNAASEQKDSVISTETITQSTSASTDTYQLSSVSAADSINQSQATSADKVTSTASLAASTDAKSNANTATSDSAATESSVTSVGEVATNESVSATSGSTASSSLASTAVSTSQTSSNAVQSVTNQVVSNQSAVSATAVTTSEAAATSVSSSATQDVHNEESDQFIAGDHSNTNTASQVPSAGSINSYVNASGQNEINIPTGLSAEVQAQWLVNAKQQATLDWQTTGRSQIITMNDASVDSWTIGDSSRPTVDAVDIFSYQGGMTQANFNTLKQLGVKTVIVKLTENTNYTNPYASNQIKMARAAGLNVEVYHYAKFSTASAAAAEANYLASVMNNMGLASSTLIFADMEDTSTYSAGITANLNCFWSTLSSRGYTNHGVYTYVSYQYRDAVVSTVGANRTWMALDVV